MKILLSILILLFGTFAKAQDSSYAKKIDDILEKLQTNDLTNDEKKDLKPIAFDLQNRGQILDESKHDYEGSLELIRKAIVIFKYLNDTLNTANNLKFEGYLLGRFGKFSEAKTEIALAIKMFQSKGKDWGVAVSKFDLCRVYEFENKLDSAIYYCTETVTYWKSKNVVPRMVGNQCMLINLLSKSNKLSQGKILQQETEKLIQDPNLNWQDIIDYYLVSAQLYKAANDSIVSAKYKKLYTDKVAELKKEGITAKSYFSIQP